MRAGLPPAASLEWAYFLDVDGTLIEIADTPDAVHVDTALLDLIAGLCRESGGAMALVSGVDIVLDQPKETRQGNSQPIDPRAEHGEHGRQHGQGKEQGGQHRDDAADPHAAQGGGVEDRQR